MAQRLCRRGAREAGAQSGGCKGGGDVDYALELSAELPKAEEEVSEVAISMQDRITAQPMMYFGAEEELTG